MRELQNILSRLRVFGNWEEIINELDLKRQSFDISRSEEHVLAGNPVVDIFLDFKGENSLDHASFSLKNITKKFADRVEKEVISSVLDLTEWNRTKASKILNVSYKTLLFKISDLNIKKHPNQKSLKWARLSMSF